MITWQKKARGSEKSCVKGMYLISVVIGIKVVMRKNGRINNRSDRNKDESMGKNVEN